MSLAEDWDSLPTAGTSRRSLADEWDSITPAQARAAEKEVPSIAGFVKTGVDATTAPARAAASVVTTVGSSILGGWKGLAELARGGSIQDASNAVHETALEGTYRPQEGTLGGDVLSGWEHPANPLNWPGMAANKAGEFTTDVATRAGASPEVAAGGGTAVNTGMNALPAIFLKKGGGAVRAEP